MIQNNHTYSGGFTLVELLLYLSLTTVLVVLMGVIGTTVMSGYVKIQAAEELQYTSQFAAETIRRIVSQSDYIVSPLGGETAEMLSVGMNESAATLTRIELVDGRIRVQVGEQSPQFISGEGVRVTVLEFTNVTSGAAPGSVRLQAELEHRDSAYQTPYVASTTLSTTINLQFP